ncbi:MAG: hypothetical protein IJL18_05290 [Synergistaceae bacterium]|nr:hypothetical protein [Synergistaceae bacterium]
MKRLYFALIALSVFVFSGCGGGGGGSGSSSTGGSPKISPDVKQVIVLSSPAFERNKRYRIYKGATLSGMNGAKYFISNTGSEAVQSTLNLGFSEEFNANESFIVVNYAPDYESHSGSVVFAYDPSGVNDSFTSGGNIAFTGGSLMRYRSLTLSENVNASEVRSSAKPQDADIYAEFESERGITTFAMGSGTSLSFIAVDGESYLSRDIPSSGNVLRLVHKVNTFSGIISD